MRERYLWVMKSSFYIRPPFCPLAQRQRKRLLIARLQVRILRGQLTLSRRELVIFAPDPVFG